MVNIKSWVEYTPLNEHYHSCSNSYKTDRPKDRALLVIQDGVVLMLDYIGPGFDYLRDAACKSMYDDFIKYNEDVDLEKLDPGVYIWEGCFVSDKIETYYGTEYDYHLEGNVRKATKEELKDYQTEESAWDPGLWYQEVKEDECEFVGSKMYIEPKTVKSWKELARDIEAARKFAIDNVCCIISAKQINNGNISSNSFVNSEAAPKVFKKIQE